MNPLIVDASVAFKWFVPDASEPDVPAAKALLAQHYSGERLLTVPALLYYEVANVLLFGRARFEESEVEAMLADLFAIPLRVVPPGPLELRHAANLSRRRGLSAYDASYLALAEALDAELVTADRRLARKAGHGSRVRLLGTSGDP